MQPIKIINLKAAVSKIRYIGEGRICVVDEDNTVRIYDLKEFKLVGGFRIKLPKNNVFSNETSISKNGNLVAIAVRGKHKVTVWDVNKKQLLYTLGWHKGDILSVDFDSEEKYLLSGGEDGRAYMWSMKTGKMVSSLPPHADYVTSVAFSKNSLWAATGSYDKSVCITNISSMGVSYKKRIHKGAVTCLNFLSKQKLISGDKSGEIALWNYAKGTVENRFIGMTDMIVSVVFDVNEKYMFVAAKGNKKIALYSLENNELITDSFIKVLEIPSELEYIAEFNYLVIGTVDGNIYVYDLYADEKKLISFVSSNDLSAAYELVIRNPFLKSTKTYELMEKKWEEILSKSQQLLERGEINAAKQILSPYLKVALKRNFIQSLINDFNEFEKFKNAVINKRYPLAYSIVAKYPFLKNTVYYKKMEDIWKQAFNKAKTLIMKKGSDEEVKELLKPFRGVTQKTPFIQSLFNQKQLFHLLSQKLAKRDFTEFFMLVNRYPFLSESEEYQKAVSYGENLLKKAYELLKKGEYKKVLHIAEMLKSFPNYKEEVKELEKQAKTLIEFHRLLAEKDLGKIEKFVYEHPFLEDNEDYKKLQKEWSEALEKAEKFASKGDISSIFETVKPYINIRVKAAKIGQILRSAYLNQILSLLAKVLKGEKKETIQTYLQKAVDNYIKLFGYDSEIEDLVQKANKLGMKIKIFHTNESNVLNWVSYKLPSKIWDDLEEV